jgi:hypothetical protein
MTIKIDDSECRKTGGTVRPVGCQDVELARGDVHFCEAPGLITSILTAGDQAKGDGTIALLIYRDARPGEDHGHGYLTQLDAEGARDIGASLINLANQIDPKGTN